MSNFLSENNYAVQPMVEQEQKYTYRQSSQISGQTGLIGYLRGDMGSNGNEFWSTWNDFAARLKTDEFKEEFDKVVNALREEGGILSNRRQLSSYCYLHPDSSFENDRNEYGVRLDTDKYSYLLRLNPNRGEYNVYCYCYEKAALNRHLENAAKGIRFITSDYKDLFYIPDNEKIRVIEADGSQQEYYCRYIDQTHVEIGYNIYHICQFAELIEKNGRHVEPVNPEYLPATVDEVLKNAKTKSEQSGSDKTTDKADKEFDV